MAKVLTVLVAGGWLAARRARLRRPLLVSALFLAVAEAGVAPFILSAVGISKIIRPRSEIPRAAVRLAYRCLGGHPVWAVSLPVLVLGVAGGITVVCVAVAARHGKPDAARALLVAVTTGLCAALAARFATGSFDALSASYNLWAVPAVILAGASAVTAQDGALRRIGVAGAALLLLANLTATCLLAWHGDAYAHSASDRVNAELAAMGAPSDVAVVLDGRGKWAHAFCPLRYAFGSSLPQYLAEREPDGSLALRPLPGSLPLQPLESMGSAGTRRLVLVDFEDLGADGVARYVRSRQAPELGDGRVLHAFEALGWVPVRSETLVALGAERVDVLERGPATPR